MPDTLFDKVWDMHQVAELPGAVSLLHVDRHLMHELTGSAAIAQLERRGLALRNPELSFGTPGHLISTRPGRTGGDEEWSSAMVDTRHQPAFSWRCKRDQCATLSQPWRTAAFILSQVERPFLL